VPIDPLGEIARAVAISSCAQMAAAVLRNLSLSPREDFWPSLGWFGDMFKEKAL
jgi:hypothetical protein